MRQRATLQVVRQELEVKTPEGESKVVSEQSNFNKPLKFEAPTDAKDIITPNQEAPPRRAPCSLTAISLPPTVPAPIPGTALDNVCWCAAFFYFLVFAEKFDKSFPPCRVVTTNL